jgi:DNA-binding NtrC family response regulator
VLVHVPALVERLEDIPILGRHFLDAVGSRSTLSCPAIRALQAYHWPGNVRELKQIVEWAAVLSPAVIDEGSIVRALSQRTTTSPGGDSVLLARRELHEILVRHRWDTDATARELGIHRATLYRRMKRLRITVPHQWEIRTTRRAAAASES